MIARPLLQLLLLLSLPLVSGIHAQEASSPSVFTVDDRALKERFHQELEALVGNEDVPKGSQLLSMIQTSNSAAISIPASTAKEATLHSPQIYRQATQGTVIIGHLYKCDKCTKWHNSMAGGVVIDPSGIVVTNHHVMESERAELFGAMTSGGEVFPIIEVIAASESDDLALVRLDTAGRQLEALSIAPSDTPVGAEVRVVSHPDGRYYTYSEGIVARYFFSPSAKARRMQIHRRLRPWFQRLWRLQRQGSAHRNRIFHPLHLLHGKKRSAEESSNGSQELHSRCQPAQTSGFCQHRLTHRPTLRNFPRV